MSVFRSLLHRAVYPIAPVGGHPLLFAVYPVLFLWSQNVAEVAAGDVVEALGIVVLAAVAGTVALSVLFGDRRRAALVATPVLVGALLYGHVASVADIGAAQRHFGWLALVLIGAVAAARLGPRRLASVDLALSVFGLILVAIPAATIVPYEIQEAFGDRAGPAAGGQPLETSTIAPRRDVYWIVLDRYGSDRSLQLRFGRDNDLTPWLSERGFEVLHDSHANYVATSLSMATTLNMAHLEDLTGLVGSAESTYAPLYARLQGSRVVQQFKALGYRYHHVGSWWNPTRADVAADVNHSADPRPEFTTFFLQYTVMPVIVESFGLEDRPASFAPVHHAHNTFALDTLDGLRDVPGPKFVLAHLLLPHPPYVFDRDGRFMASDEAEALGENEAWHRQLTWTNSRLRSFVEGLLDRPQAERPIVILQADEGPWTGPYEADKLGYDWRTASPDELEIKFGILNAWYVPEGSDLGLEKRMTAINTFPVLFGRYFGLDAEPLPDRVTASRAWNRPYELIDITERLPSLD